MMEEEIGPSCEARGLCLEDDTFLLPAQDVLVSESATVEEEPSEYRSREGAKVLKLK